MRHHLQQLPSGAESVQTDQRLGVQGHDGNPIVEELVLLGDLRPAAEACKCQVDLDLVELHLDDGDERLLNGAEFTDLMLVAEKAEQGVEEFVSGDHGRCDAQGVDVGALVRDVQHVGAVGDDPTTDLLGVSPVRATA